MQLPDFQLCFDFYYDRVDGLTLRSSLLDFFLQFRGP